MSIKELYNIFKFLKGSKSCVILDEYLEMRTFGERTDTMMKLHDEIMKISIKK